MRVRELTESELIARFAPILPFGAATRIGPGDDAALLASPDGQVLVSTDVLVAGRHFRPEWGTATDVGYRAAMQNLADIAAMGGRATGIVVALVLPESTAVDWVLDLARGLAQACHPLGVGVVGGDLSAGTELAIAVTVLGSLDGRAAIRRDGARPGDVLAHAGTLGWAAAGLAASIAGRARDWPAATAAFLRPQPPLSAGPAAAAAGAHALIDISDGLVTDAGRIAAASGVRIDIAAAALADPALADIARSLDLSATDWLLAGGEDHGLLAAFPPQVPLPAEFRAIGEVMGGGQPAVLIDGVLPPESAVGWDHFRRTRD
ncbi:MAG: thiamine-phosphate kinase [Beutenbergiaceae bacterium]